MSAIVSFEHPALGLLKVFQDEKGREYYRVIDVCSILRLANPAQAIKRHVRSKYVFQFNDGTNRAGLTNYVSEAGLYQLIFKSKTEMAEQFQDWVFEEVLPKLRSQGLYLVKNQDESLAKYKIREQALLQENARLQQYTFEAAIFRLNDPKFIADQKSTIIDEEDGHISGFCNSVKKISRYLGYQLDVDLYKIAQDEIFEKVKQRLGANWLKVTDRFYWILDKDDKYLYVKDLLLIIYESLINLDKEYGRPSEYDSEKFYNHYQLNFFGINKQEVKNSKKSS